MDINVYKALIDNSNRVRAYDFSTIVKKPRKLSGKYMTIKKQPVCQKRDLIFNI